MQKYLIEARQLLTLAIPVMLAQVAQASMGFIDTVMSGTFGTKDMAAVAIGSSIWLPIIMFGHGLLLALTPTIAQLNGSGCRNIISHHISQAYILAGAVSIIIMISLFLASNVIFIVKTMDPELARISSGYLKALIWGVPGYLFFQVVKNQCEGLSNTKPGMIFGFIGLIFNILINYILIYGYFNLPVFGGIGCGIATAFVYWIMFILIKIWVIYFSSMKDIYKKINICKIDWNIFFRLIKLGLPVASALFFEVTLFAIVALILSPMGVIAVAGHQIALNFSSLMFVLPLSLSVASTIRIGFCLGKNTLSDACISAWTAQIVGVLMAITTAIFTVIFRENIALLYDKDPNVLFIAKKLMFLAAIYQISDSIQVIGSGILRGYKDTRSIFFITFISYWILGLPSGYILAMTELIVPALGPIGFWYGFIIGLTTSAIMMISRMKKIQSLPDKVILRRITY